MKNRLHSMIGEVIDEVNQTRDVPIPTDDVLSVVLYGDDGVFDSLHLVSFLALLEEAIEDEVGVQISLTSEKAVSQKVSPFSCVKNLIDFADEEIRLALANGTAAEHDSELVPRVG